jgi:hypothetical protein
VRRLAAPNRRRDEGFGECHSLSAGGNFKLMKDLSAPIVVTGKHWGGLRLAYSF